MEVQGESYGVRPPPEYYLERAKYKYCQELEAAAEDTTMSARETGDRKMPALFRSKRISVRDKMKSSASKTSGGKPLKIRCPI